MWQCDAVQARDSYGWAQICSSVSHSCWECPESLLPVVLGASSWAWPAKVGILDKIWLFWNHFHTWKSAMWLIQILSVRLDNLVLGQQMHTHVHTIWTMRMVMWGFNCEHHLQHLGDCNSKYLDKTSKALNNIHPFSEKWKYLCYQGSLSMFNAL